MAISVVLGTGGLSAVSGSAAIAKTTTTVDPGVSSSEPFTLSGAGDLVVDEAGGHVFLTGRDYETSSNYDGSPQLERASDIVVVRGLDGSPQAVIDNLPGATGLALDAARSRLYVAVRRDDAIVAVDTRTLKVVARYPTGQTSRPLWLAMSGSVVWFEGTYGLRALDPASGVVQTEYRTMACSQGRLRSVPAAPGVVVGSADRSVCSWRVSGTAVLSQQLISFDREVGDLALSADGTEVTSSFDAYRVSDLAKVGHYGPSNVFGYRGNALSGTGTMATTQRRSGNESSKDDVVFLGKGTEIGRISLQTAAYQLTFNADSSKLYYLSGGEPDDVHLDILTNPLVPSTQVTVARTSDWYVFLHDPVSFVGTLTAGGQPLPKTELRVTRTDSEATTALPTVTTDADGKYTVTDVPAQAGRNSYCIGYDGGGKYRPSCERITVTVYMLVDISLEVTDTSDTPHDVSVRGRVTAEGKPLAGAQLSVATYRGQNIDPDDVREGVVTDEDGNFTAGPFTPKGHDDPYVGKVYVRFPGDDLHWTASKTADFSVRRPAETSEFVMSAQNTPLGDTLIFGGIQTRAGGIKTTLSVTRTDSSGTTSMPDVTTSSTGYVQFRDAARPGTTSYRLGYAGTSFVPASSVTATIVRPNTNAITVTADQPQYLAGTAAAKATITAHLRAAGPNRTVTIYTTKRGGLRHVLASGPVDSVGSLSATMSITKSTVFTAEYRTGATVIRGTVTANVDRDPPRCIRCVPVRPRSARSAR